MDQFQFYKGYEMLVCSWYKIKKRGSKFFPSNGFATCSNRWQIHLKEKSSCERSSVLKLIWIKFVLTPIYTIIQFAKMLGSNKNLAWATFCIHKSAQAEILLQPSRNLTWTKHILEPGLKVAILENKHHQSLLYSMTNSLNK